MRMREDWQLMNDDQLKKTELFQEAKRMWALYGNEIMKHKKNVQRRKDVRGDIL